MLHASVLWVITGSGNGLALVSYNMDYVDLDGRQRPLKFHHSPTWFRGQSHRSRITGSNADS